MPDPKQTQDNNTELTEEQKRIAAELEAEEAAALADGEEEDDEKPLSERDRAMAQLIAARNGELDNTDEAVTHPRERAEHPGHTPDPDPENNENTDEQLLLDKAKESGDDSKQTGAEAPPVTSLEGLPIHFKDGVPHMKLKVKGEEVDLPLDRIQGMSQKLVYADRLVQEARAQEQSLQEREAAIAERERRFQESLAQPPATRQGAEVDHKSLRDAAEGFMETLFDGSREDAVEKLTELLAAKAPTPAESGMSAAEIEATVKRVATDAIRAANQEQVNAWRENDIRAGVQQFEAKYPNLASDPFLESLVDRRTEDLANEHPEWAPSQVIMAAAEEINRFAESRKEAPAPAPAAPETSVRQERKSGLVPIPQANRSTRFEKPVPQTRDLTPAGAIEAMKAERAAVRGQQG